MGRLGKLGGGEAAIGGCGVHVEVNHGVARHRDAGDAPADAIGVGCEHQTISRSSSTSRHPPRCPPPARPARYLQERALCRAGDHAILHFDLDVEVEV